MSKICLAFLGLLALLVLVRATEDEEEVSLTEGNTISREIRDAGMSRPKKGKYKRPGERKGHRAKKGKFKRPGERKGRRSKKGKSKRPGERKGRRSKKGKSKRPGERKGRRSKKGKSKRPGERKGKKNRGKHQRPGERTIGCPACPAPPQCKRNATMCLDTAVTAMRMWKDVAGNFIRQSKRISKKMNVAGGKNSKGSVFGEVAATLMTIGGGNSSSEVTSLTCAKKNTTDGAKQLQNLTSTLTMCQENINTACNTSMPPVDMAFIDQCALTVDQFSAAAELCSDMGADSCDCWTGEELGERRPFGNQ